MKYIFLAILSAVLLSISWPTYGVPFFIFVAFVPLLFMEHFVSQDIVKRKGWGIFGCSYLAFMIWNIVTTGWLYYAQNPNVRYISVLLLVQKKSKTINKFSFFCGGMDVF